MRIRRPMVAATLTLLAALALVLAVPPAGLAAGPAPSTGDARLADDGALDSGKDVHEHEQHGGAKGHLPSAQSNVRRVGKLDIADGPGRIADVSAKGNYAYLTSFREPECGTGGVEVVDISEPAKPKHAKTIPSHTDSYAGEGSQVVSLDTPAFRGDLLVYNNEQCGDQGVGGVTLVDVTNPLRPKKLVEGFGDFTVPGKSQTHANQIHSAFAWQAGAKAYVVMVDDEESEDIDILDITNPSRPKLVSETDLTDETSQPLGAVHGDAAFLHDMVVKEIDGKQVMLASYWDGGYAKLDVTDPASPRFLVDTNFAPFDPVRETFGQLVSPEGNAHQAEFTRDDRWILAADEDFDPYRVTAKITGGEYAGSEFTAMQGSDVPHIDKDRSLSGDTVYAGRACGPLPAGSGAGKLAVIERGDCTFTEKAQNVQAAGYDGGIVFNRPGANGCEAVLSMLVEADIPMAFVSRKDGFRILGESVREENYSCGADGTGTAVSTRVGDPGSPVDIRAVFDGWGYVHQYDASSMQEVDTYAIPEGQDPAFAEGFGDLSVHEVATDPDEDLAYLSHYAGGFRVVKYGRGGIKEVGKYIADGGDIADGGGNNFWGVEVHKHPNGQKYVLASDRDSGLWLFQYTGG